MAESKLERFLMRELRGVEIALGVTTNHVRAKYRAGSLAPDDLRQVAKRHHEIAAALDQHAAELDADELE